MAFLEKRKIIQPIFIYFKLKAQKGIKSGYNKFSVYLFKNISTMTSITNIEANTAIDNTV